MCRHVVKNFDCAPHLTLATRAHILAESLRNKLSGLADDLSVLRPYGVMTDADLKLLLVVFLSGDDALRSIYLLKRDYSGHFVEKSQFR